MGIHQQRNKEAIYKIKLGRHLSCFLPGLVVTLAYFSFILYFHEQEAFKFATILYIIILVPIGLLHLDYYSLNKGFLLTIDNVDKKFTIKEANKSIEICYSEVEKVEFVHSAFTLFSGYFYYRITLKDKEVFILTSLIVDLMVFSNFREKFDERFVLFPLTP